MISCTLQNFYLYDLKLFLEHLWMDFQSWWHWVHFSLLPHVAGSRAAKKIIKRPRRFLWPKSMALQLWLLWRNWVSGNGDEGTLRQTTREFLQTELEVVLCLSLQVQPFLTHSQCWVFQLEKDALQHGIFLDLLSFWKTTETTYFAVVMLGFDGAGVLTSVLQGSCVMRWSRKKMLWQLEENLRLGEQTTLSLSRKRW